MKQHILHCIKFRLYQEVFSWVIREKQWKVKLQKNIKEKKFVNYTMMQIQKQPLTGVV